MATDTDLIGLIAASCVMSVFIIGLTIFLARTCHTRMERMRRKQMLNNISASELETEPNYEVFSVASPSEVASEVPRRMSVYRPKILSEGEQTELDEYLVQGNSHESRPTSHWNNTSEYPSNNNGIDESENVSAGDTNSSEENRKYTLAREEIRANGYVREGFIPVSFHNNYVAHVRDDYYHMNIGHRHQPVQIITGRSVNNNIDPGNVVSSSERDVVRGGHIVKHIVTNMADRQRRHSVKNIVNTTADRQRKPEHSVSSSESDVVSGGHIVKNFVHTTAERQRRHSVEDIVNTTSDRQRKPEHSVSSNDSDVVSGGHSVKNSVHMTADRQRKQEQSVSWSESDVVSGEHIVKNIVHTTADRQGKTEHSVSWSESDVVSGGHIVKNIANTTADRQWSPENSISSSERVDVRGTHTVKNIVNTTVDRQRRHSVENIVNTTADRQWTPENSISSNERYDLRGIHIVKNIVNTTADRQRTPEHSISSNERDVDRGDIVKHTVTKTADTQRKPGRLVSLRDKVVRVGHSVKNIITSTSDREPKPGYLVSSSEREAVDIVKNITTSTADRQRKPGQVVSSSEKDVGSRRNISKHIVTNTADRQIHSGHVISSRDGDDVQGRHIVKHIVTSTADGQLNPWHFVGLSDRDFVRGGYIVKNIVTTTAGRHLHPGYVVNASERDVVQGGDIVNHIVTTTADRHKPEHLVSSNEKDVVSRGHIIKHFVINTPDRQLDPGHLVSSSERDIVRGGQNVNHIVSNTADIHLELEQEEDVHSGVNQFQKQSKVHLPNPSVYIERVQKHTEHTPLKTDGFVSLISIKDSDNHRIREDLQTVHDEQTRRNISINKIIDHKGREASWEASEKGKYAERKVHDFLFSQAADDDGWVADDDEEDERHGKVHKPAKIKVPVIQDKSFDDDNWLDEFRTSSLRSSRRQEDNTSTKRLDDPMSLFYSASKNYKVIKKHSSHKPPDWLVQTYAESAAEVEDLGSSTKAAQFLDTSFVANEHKEQAMVFSQASINVEEDTSSVRGLTLAHSHPGLNDDDEQYTIVDYIDYD